jgi:dihydrofolate synthase/folylpolyglutamate synthase
MQNIAWANFFDILLFIALRYFGEKKVDYIVLETGIGGRYDSTNFLESPAVSVITNIGMDHQALLGDTIEEIAGQKAGIIKKGIHVFITAKQKQSVLDVFTEEARLKSAPLSFVPASEDEIRSAGLSLGYGVQAENASLAIAVLKHLMVPVRGLTLFYWPCRMEEFSVHGVPIILDGNHNGESVRLFLNGVRLLFPGYRIVVIFGGGGDKCLSDMVVEVVAGADLIVPVQSRHFKATGDLCMYRRIRKTDVK